MVRELTWSDYQQMIKTDEDFQLVDVREIEEHQQFNIGGELIPMSELMLMAVKVSRLKPVLVYCKRGIRSNLAVQMLQSRLGLTNLYSLSGGIIQQMPSRQLSSPAARA